MQTSHSTLSRWSMNSVGTKHVQSQSMIPSTRDVVILEKTGQCTCAVVKVPESLCQFVQDSAIRVRLG